MKLKFYFIMLLDPVDVPRLYGNPEDIYSTHLHLHNFVYWLD